VNVIQSKHIGAVTSPQYDASIFYWPLDFNPNIVILYSRIENIGYIMHLKAQDVLFLLKLVSIRNNKWTFNKLAVEMGMSPSEVHAASNRAIKARLAAKKDDRIRPNIRNLKEFLFHGIQYVFVPEHSGMNRGVPTSYAAEPLKSHFLLDNEPPPVWPHPEGSVRGESFSPLYKSAPIAAKNDPVLYELLALVDAIRGGRTREREIAKKELEARLERYA